MGNDGSNVIGMLLSDMICGIGSDFEEVFSPSRNIIKPQLFINGFEATKNMITPTKNGVLTLDAHLNGIPMNIHGTALVMAPDFRKTEKCLIILQTEI